MPIDFAAMKDAANSNFSAILIDFQSEPVLAESSFVILLVPF